jgi:beta-phosphoglucomutase
MTWGVIFDMDGVLVMSEDAHWESWRRVAETRGVELTHAVFLSCFGRVNPDCVRIMFGVATGPEESALIAEEKERAFREILGAGVPLADGVVPLLESLTSHGAVLAIGSSAPPENVDLVLDAGGLRRYFAATVDGTQVARGKPAPDVFLRGAQLLGLGPRACVVVEDAPAGIAAARAAAMTAVAVTTTNTEGSLRDAGAHRVYRCVADLTAQSLRPEAC